MKYTEKQINDILHSTYPNHETNINRMNQIGVLDFESRLKHYRPMSIMDTAFLGGRGGACLTTTTYDHSGDTKVSTRDVSSVINISNGQSSRFAIEIESGYSAVGTSVKKVSVNILRVGTLVGNCYIRIRDSSNNIKGEGETDAVSLSTSATVVEFTLDNCVEIEVGDRVSFEYDGSAHPTNYIALGTSTPAWVSLIDQEAWNGTGWDLDPDGAGAGRKWMFTFDSDPTI